MIEIFLMVYVVANVGAGIVALFTYLNYCDSIKVASLWNDKTKLKAVPENFPTKGTVLFFGYGLTMWFIKFCFSPRGQKA